MIKRTTVLASAGHEAWAIDTWRDHIEAMLTKGLRADGASGERTLKLNATTNAADVGVCDLVTIATRTRDVGPNATLRVAAR